MKRTHSVYDLLAGPVNKPRIEPEPAVLFTEQHRQILERDGAVVIPNVVPPEECQRIHQEMINFHQRWDPLLSPATPQNWTTSRIPPGPGHGLNQSFSHEQFVWDVRQHSRVAQVFAEMYGTKLQDLLTSMDGFRFLIKGRNHVPGSWAHIDETPTHRRDKRPNTTAYKCVQGSIAITSSEAADDGDFVFWKGGHRIHKRFFDAHPEAKAECMKKSDNWYKFDQDEFLNHICPDALAYLEPNDPAVLAGAESFPLERVRIRRPAGAMVLWYSKTPHQSHPPGPNALHDAAVVFVSMAPRHLATAQELERRIGFFEQRRCTSHWAILGLKLFPRHPWLRSAERIEQFQTRLANLGGFNRPVALTPLGRRLVGYEK